MRKKTLVLVIALMSISLVGLIGFQAYWIHHAVKMEEEVFDRNVNDALHQMARRLETQEAVHFLKEEAPQLREAALTPTLVKQVTPKKTRARVASKNMVAPTVAPPAPPTPEPRPQPTQVHVYRQNESHSGPNAAVGKIYYSPRPDSMEKKGLVELFGRGNIDSMVIWRVLATQNLQSDSLLRKNIHRTLPTPPTEATWSWKMDYDSLISKKQHEIFKHVLPKDVSAITIKGKHINVITDSLILRAIGRAPLLARDSLLRRSIHQKAAMVAPHAAKSTPAPLFPRPSATTKTSVTVPPEAPTVVPEKNPEQKAQAKAQHLSQVMQQIAVEYVRKETPLPQRLSQLGMKDLLAAELANRSITTPYHYTLQTQTKPEQPTILRTASVTSLLPQPTPENQYTIRLFPNDIMTAPSYLQVHFPNRQLYLWQRLLLPSAMSLVFTLIIILTFSVTLYTILRQKKISEIKNDFINNMTHEFKTPISTISLALDALVNPKVRTDEVRVNYYANIIKDENKRMHQQVEKVLQTAQMERRRLQLSLEQIDVHQLIAKAVEPFKLHIAQRQGNLELKLDAQSALIWADPGHLLNMVANLLDNANKYSPNAPQIVVQTTSIAKGLHISVEDKGAGMSREAQKRVFEKFYRVPTGNLHNVKGFGLGLSYVKTMAEAHAGTIHLRSELGKGSKFTLWLPYQKQPSFTSHS